MTELVRCLLQAAAAEESSEEEESDGDDVDEPAKPAAKVRTSSAYCLCIYLTVVLRA